jgi:hypothetical protein
VIDGKLEDWKKQEAKTVILIAEMDLHNPFGATVRKTCIQ